MAMRVQPTRFIRRGRRSPPMRNYRAPANERSPVYGATRIARRSVTPGAIASAGSSNLELFVNEGAAKKQGVTLSADLLKDAKEVIK